MRPIKLTGLLVLLSLSLTPEALAASGSGLDEQPVIRRQLMLRGSRHELSVALGGTIADSFSRNYMLGASYQYYFDNWIGVGLSLSANLCGVLGGMCKTALAEDVEATNPDVDSMDDVSRLSMMAIPQLTVVPISGKLGLFRRIIHFDTHLVAGAAVVKVSSEGGEIDETLYGPAIGIGQRFFLGDGLAITFSLQDIILNRVLNTTESGKKADAQYENNFVFLIGVNFFLPGKVEVSH
ncbi:MAG: outer membrane beta-barrel domain-containing protein [Deltaproteobacteria bacterium]|nr:outer membrane beta-barrel domain-containing protein [Deltaproteobacteria bacterium]